ATMPTAQAEMYTSGTQVMTNGPQTNPGDRSGSWSAQQNVRDSERYEAVVHANGSFRANRVQKECGPINDPQLHANCIASFGKQRASSIWSGGYRYYCGALLILRR